MRRSWEEYKFGFGDPDGDYYWLGNDLLHELTVSGRYKLRFTLQSRSFPSSWYYAIYSTFFILPEEHNYTLHFQGFSGNASYNALGSQNGRMFSTHDRDNDQNQVLNCAERVGGGFWYWDYCGGCLVNGDRKTGNFFWVRLPGGRHLQSSQMWLECK